MYRDSAASLKARIVEFERKVEVAEEATAKRKEEVASLSSQLFPLFNNLSNTLEPVTPKHGVSPTQVIVLGCISVMSVPILPLAVLWRSRRSDIRALRRASRDLRRLRQQLAEARRTLQHYKSPTSSES